MRLTREIDVQRFEASRRVSEALRCLAPLATIKRDLSPKRLGASAAQLVEGVGLDGGQESDRHIESAGVTFGAGRGEQAGRASRLVWGHRGSLLEKGRRGGESAASLGASGGTLEFDRDLLVGPERRVCEMPRPAVRIDPLIGRLGERAVDGVSLRKRRRTVGGRADERVSEPHPGAELEQPNLGSRSRRLGSDPELFSSAPHQDRLADRIGRREHDEPTGVRREHLEPTAEALLNAVGQRRRNRYRESTGKFGGRGPARQLEQRQRVAARLGDDLFPHARVDRSRERRGEQGAGIGAVESIEPELRQARQLTPLGRLADGEQECHALRQQTTCDEPEDLDGGVIQPLEVIHEAEQGLLMGSGSHQTERCETDEEAARWIATRKAKRNAEGVRLGLREDVELVEYRGT